VYFINPAGIENILTRITGNNASNILGKLGVEGAANLFLINPNGILFGPNASLDIRGSFIATTGDEIKLGQNGLFSAINPENSNLLSVKPSALFFNQLASQTKGRIINQSMADGIGLAVPPGEKLGFVAREIILNGGRISGQQSSIELGAVGDESLVKINSTETGDTLDYSEVTNFRDIQIINGSAINNIGLGSGPIQIQGKDITVAGLSQITATTLGDRDGDTFSINASESLTIVDSLLVSNAEVTATGKGSNINVDTQNLTITEGGLLVVTTGGAGQGGDLRVKATEIKIVGGNPSLGENELLTSEIITNIAPGATGKGGNMTIDTQRLILRDGGVINTSVSGAGEGGELVVRAEEIEATGVLESVVIPSGLRTDVLPGGSGKGGNLTVNTEKLTLATGGQIGSGALSSGAGGNIEVNAVEISAIGTSFQGNESAFPPLTLLLQTLSGQLPSGLLTTVTPTATGDGGNLTVNTQKLTIEGGAQIGAGTFGQSPSGDVTIKASEIEAIGNAPGDQFSTTIFTSVFAGGSGQGGDLRVETQGLTLKDGAQIRAGTSAVGDSGDIILKANEILLIGRSSEKRSGSSIVAGVEDLTSFGLGRGIGDGGNISIETDRLSILDGAVISALTQGEGLAGSISINARENITLSRRDSTLNNPSAINASTEANATGEGGNISLATPLLNLDRGAVIRATSRSESNGGDLILNVDTLNLANGSQILTSSFSDGNAGTITINADSAITLSSIDSSSNNREVQIFNSETAIASESTNNGDAGSITINTPQLRVEDRAITVGSSGSGVAGSLNINAPSIELNNGTLSAETAAGDQGNITIQASEINLTNNSEITTNARNDATGGDIDIDTKFLIGLDNSNISANAIVGQGGNIAITGEGVFLDNSSEITATSALGIDGSV
ncbi:filamentous hemagglutinin N-terminal domain-containing protein, partial [Dapis sp. BLCC M229]|uniref:two-partner secretion domain-containing protein n=1 Tax=Dapis sp. BLCC M229 TaxID=3400188 RepID=UPI003CEEDA5B